jgi:hypothetical protein
MRLAYFYSALRKTLPKIVIPPKNISMTQEMAPGPGGDDIAFDVAGIGEAGDGKGACPLTGK